MGLECCFQERFSWPAGWHFPIFPCKGPGLTLSLASFTRDSGVFKSFPVAVTPCDAETPVTPRGPCSRRTQGCGSGSCGRAPVPLQPSWPDAVTRDRVTRHVGAVGGADGASRPSVPTLVRLGGQREPSTRGSPCGTSWGHTTGDAPGAELDKMPGGQHSQDVADRRNPTAVKAHRLGGAMPSGHRNLRSRARQRVPFGLGLA